MEGAAAPIFMLPSNSTAGCAPTEMPGFVGKTLGMVLVVGTFLTYMPQVHMIMYNRSSAGVSPATCAMLAWYVSSNLASSIAVKWHQIQFCAHGASCLYLLLDALQQLTGSMGWLSVLTCVAIFPPHNTLRIRALALFSVVLAVTLYTLVASLSIGAPCQQSTLRVAQYIGYFSSALAFVCMLPQQLYTWREGPGQISFFLYIVQAIGAVLVLVNQIYISEDPWPVWLPMLVSGTMMLLVLGTALFQRFCGYPHGFSHGRRGSLDATYADGLLNGTRTPEDGLAANLQTAPGSS